MCLQICWDTICDHEYERAFMKCTERQLLESINDPDLPALPDCPRRQDKSYVHDFCCSTDCCTRLSDAAWRDYVRAAEDAGMIQTGQAGPSIPNSSDPLVERALQLRDEFNKHRECDAKRAAADAELERARRSGQDDDELEDNEREQSRGRRSRR